MVTRMTFEALDEAETTAEAIDKAGFEVALIEQRDSDDPQDAEEMTWLVATPARAYEIEELVPPSTPMTDDATEVNGPVLED